MADAPEFRAARRYLRRQNRALTFLGLAFVVAGTQFFLDPAALERSAVGSALAGLWDEAWSLLYIVGGAFIVYGTQRPSPRLELPGHTLVACALLVNLGAIFVALGWAGIGRTPLYLVALWVLWGRVHDLRAVRERRQGLPDGRPPAHRLERRQPSAERLGAMVTLPLILSAVDGGSLLIALMGGGIVTALVQLLLYRPQQRDMLSRTVDHATAAAERALAFQAGQVQAAQEALERAQQKIGVLEADLDKHREREDELVARCEALEDRVAELERD